MKKYKHHAFPFWYSDVQSDENNEDFYANVEFQEDFGVFKKGTNYPEFRVAMSCYEPEFPDFTFCGQSKLLV